MIGEGENSLEYYYDMEFLEDYRMLSELSETDKITHLNSTIDMMEEHVYCLGKRVDGQVWLDNFLEEKIYSKFENFSLTNEQFRVILNRDSVLINGRKYFGIKKCLEMIKKSDILPSKICVVHGDLTLENIMVDNNGDVKLIDMDGSRLFDARELDLGKLSQSIVSRYDLWKNLDGEQISQYDGNGFKVESRFFEIEESELLSELFAKWSKVLTDPVDIVRKKSFFYMSMYFIRFVPFRMNVHINHGVFALIMATVWLNKLIGDKNEN